MAGNGDSNGKWYARLAAACLLALSGWCLKEVYANAKLIAVQEARVENVSADITEIKYDVKEIKLMLWRSKGDE